MCSSDLAAGLDVPAEQLEGLSTFDRCLIGLLILGRDKPMSAGRLAYLVSDLFDEVSVNIVQARLAAIRAHFDERGRTDILIGDRDIGYSLSQ